jgi:hypothetical protein
VRSWIRAGFEPNRSSGSNGDAEVDDESQLPVEEIVINYNINY